MVSDAFKSEREVIHFRWLVQIKYNVLEHVLVTRVGTVITCESPKSRQKLTKSRLTPKLTLPARFGKFQFISGKVKSHAKKTERPEFWAYNTDNLICNEVMKLDNASGDQ